MPITSEDMMERLEEVGPVDFILCSGSTVIVRQPVLDAMPERVFNLHPALLPVCRGPKPLQALILNGLANRYGGMTLHLMTRGIDEGEIIGQVAVPLEDKGFEEWRLNISNAGAHLVDTQLMAFLDDKLGSIPQDESIATYYNANETPSALSRDWSVERANHFMEVMLGRVPKVTVRPDFVKHKRLSLVGVPQKIGPVTQQPDKVGFFSVEFNLADCRVKIRRESYWGSLKRRAHRYISFQRIKPAFLP